MYFITETMKISTRWPSKRMEEGWAPTGIQIGQYELLNTVKSSSYNPG